MPCASGEALATMSRPEKAPQTKMTKMSQNMGVMHICRQLKFFASAAGPPDAGAGGVQPSGA